MDKTTDKHNVPEDVIETFEKYMGYKVDASKIYCYPDDGYQAVHHGRFDWYVLRREGALYKVRKHEDGHLEFS